MAISKEKKAINDKQRTDALKNKKTNVARNAAEEAQARQVGKKKSVEADRSATTASRVFGGLVGKAANAIKGRKGQGDE